MKRRRLAAGLFGGAAGALGFALVVLAGLLLYRRLEGGSGAAVAVMGIGLALAGLYASWLLGLLVFSAASGGEHGEERPT